MNEEKTITPLEQKVILFYEDALTAILVKVDDTPQVYVPVRPICDRLGLNWSGQLQRIRRDPILDEVALSVLVPTTPNEGGGSQEMICLPLDFLNGWLFGINVNRVNEEIRPLLLRYQRECYRILAAAFLERSPSADSSPSAAALIQIREMGRAIMQMAEEQLKFEARLTVHHQRLDKAAVVVGDLTKRITAIEQTLHPGGTISEEQASQLSQAVKTVALALGKKSGRNEFGSVYGEMYRRYSITAYKHLPAHKFSETMKWLTLWFQEITDDTGTTF